MCGSRSKKLLNTDPIRILIHNTRLYRMQPVNNEMQCIPLKEHQVLAYHHELLPGVAGPG